MAAPSGKLAAGWFLICLMICCIKCVELLYIKPFSYTTVFVFVCFSVRLISRCGKIPDTCAASQNAAVTA